MTTVTRQELEILPTTVLAMLLEAKVPTLKKDDQAFALDLAKKGKTSSMSSKQRYWMVEMILRSMEVNNPPPAVQKEMIPGGNNLWSIFKMAGEKLKYPKITLNLMGVGDLALTLVRKSKYGENISLTDGKSYGENQFFGRVYPNGAYEPYSKLSPAERAGIAEFLTEMAQDPAATATKYGKLSGKCMFCNSALTDENSTAAGFGPVCADNWGLKSQWKNAAKYKEQQQCE
jgi:hypothetical protein